MPVYALPQLDLSCPLLQQNKQVVSMATLGERGDVAWWIDKRTSAPCTHGLDCSESWGSICRHLNLNSQSCVGCFCLHLHEGLQGLQKWETSQSPVA